MYFIAAPTGFVCATHPEKPTSSFWISPDIRDARPFPTWERADEFAKNIVVHKFPANKKYFYIVDTEHPAAGSGVDDSYARLRDETLTQAIDIVKRAALAYDRVGALREWTALTLSMRDLEALK